MANLGKGAGGGAAGKFVRFGQQQVDRRARVVSPSEHHLVELFEWMSDVHNQHDPGQRTAPAQVLVDVPVPLVAHGLGDLGVPVAG